MLSPRHKGQQTLGVEQGFLLLTLLPFGDGHLVMGVSSEHCTIFGGIPGLYPIGPLFPSCDKQCLPRLRTMGLELLFVVKVGRIF